MKQNETQALTSSERKELLVKQAHGPARVLCVGIDEYQPNSGFQKLKKCSEDALQVYLTFKETKQLNASPDFTEYVTSQTTNHPPSKGYIISKLKELSADTEKGDRVIFYFSGHGHRIGGDGNFYLVPQDAYDDSDPDALLSLQKVTDILLESGAKQIIVILDACLSGPILLPQKIAAASSPKRLAEYLENTKGIAFLSSSETDQASFEKSKHPKLSLFTSVLIPALRGENKALDNQFLTLPSLYDYVSAEVSMIAKSMQRKQKPTLNNKATGTIVLGGFRPQLRTTDTRSFTEYPTHGLTLSEETEEHITSILTNLKRRDLTADQLAYAANNALGEYLEDDFSKYRSKLRKELKFTTSEVEVNDEYITFPGGSIEYQVKGQTTRDCLIIRDLNIDTDWFDKPETLKTLLKIFQFKPDTLTLHLNKKCKPMQEIATFESLDWEAFHESDDLVKFKWDRTTMELSTQSILFNGLDFKKLMDGNSEENSVIILNETLEALA
jgi:hypothetical protein